MLSQRTNNTAFGTAGSKNRLTGEKLKKLSVSNIKREDIPTNMNKKWWP